MKRHMSRRQWLVMILMTFSLLALMFSTAVVGDESAPLQVAKARGMIVFDPAEVVKPQPMDLANFTAKARGMIVFDVDSYEG